MSMAHNPQLSPKCPGCLQQCRSKIRLVIHVQVLRFFTVSSQRPCLHPALPPSRSGPPSHRINRMDHQPARRSPGRETSSRRNPPVGLYVGKPSNRTGAIPRRHHQNRPGQTVGKFDNGHYGRVDHRLRRDLGVGHPKLEQHWGI